MVNNLDWLGELVADRLPARHGQALHDPVHARQGLGPGPARARPVVHRVQLHAPPGVRLRAPPPDDGRRAADGRRRPVGQHHGRPRADPADQRGRRGRRDRRTAWPTSCCSSPSGREVRQERGRRLRSGWTRTGRRRTPSTSTGCNTDDRDVGTYLRWFTELPREEIEALEAETAGAPEGRAAQRALALDITTRTHGADAAAAGRRRLGGEVLDARRSTIRRSCASLFESAGGFAFDAGDAGAGDRGRSSPRPACSPRRARRAG